MPKVKTVMREKTALTGRRDKPEKKRKASLKLKISRYFSEKGKDPLDSLEYEPRTCKIANPDGSIVFEMNGIEAPKNWSQVASDILISKYIRKGGVPQYDKFGAPVIDKDGKIKLGAEKSARQVVSRLAHCWRWWGEKFRYFAGKEDAQAFEDELKFMLINQIGAPNSPQWFNTGLALNYNITGPAQGHWYAEAKTGQLKLSEDAYTHPQPHACFIQSIKDDLVNKGGIFDLIVREARIFKYGSGSGANFSSLRAEEEPLSGGGKSSGLMSWLRIFDRAAGAVKSGGTTRRASKMVVLNADHPDIEKFIEWKYREEQKASQLIAAGYSPGIDGEAYESVSGQNSNNSIRINDKFMKAVEEDGDWHLRLRTDPNQISKTVKAKELWHKIANSTWHCGDPGVQFDTNVNSWHTCPISGRINASNPCSEFMFLDDSSCNLASLNLTKFFDNKSGQFDVEAFEHAVRLWTIVLEISVLMAQFPSAEIAKNSFLFRPLGLGYANLGALLMLMGDAYDSPKGRATAASITALMTGVSYSTSSELACATGTFAKYEENKKEMLRVIRNHRRAAFNSSEEYETLNVRPYLESEADYPDYILKAAREAWDRALLDGGRFGFKNAQVTLLAPTGTIGLLMDCDTTGVEPDYALVKFKKLAGGGHFKIINQSVPPALSNLGYSKDEINSIIKHIIGTGTLDGAPHINRISLKQKGFSDDDLKKIENVLSGVFELSQSVGASKLINESFLARLGMASEKTKEPDFELFRELGFSKEQIKEANQVICGMMTIEGAPGLKDEHLSIFDCANRCGEYGKRFISAVGHIKMMAAVQPYLSGAISKTVNLPSEATVEEISDVYFESWKLGLKAIAIYRDGSKLTQPLNVSDKKESMTPRDKEIVIEYRPVRRKLPKERMSLTRKVTIAGHKMFLTVGLYEDGKPGELFIVMNQQGSFAAGMADSFAKMVSIGLQYGVPVDTIVSQLRHMRFAPMGFTGDGDVTNASSISDFLAQWFEKKFLDEKVKAIELPFFKKTDENSETKVKDIDIQGELILGDNPLKDLQKQSEKLGFSGEMCPECGAMTMVVNGKCLKCINCGATTGCS